MQHLGKTVTRERKEESLPEDGRGETGDRLDGQRKLPCRTVTKPKTPTGQRDSKEAGETAKTIFQHIVESTPDGIIIIDENGNVQYVNPAAYGFLGLKPGDRYPSGSHLSSALITEVPIIQGKDEKSTAEMLVVQAEWAGEGARLLFLRDVTERKRAGATAHQPEQLRFEFIGNISHELRRPLHAIMSFTRLMLESKVPDPETQKEFIAIIDKESGKLDRLLANLLDLSRLESGRFSIHKRRTTVTKIIHEAVEGIRKLINGTGVIINEEIPVELPEVEADEERLSQVMFNLLSNAVKFSKNEGAVTVRALTGGGELLVQVVDHGIGISEQAMTCLFERFYRGENGSDVGGAGLGLYISKQIIEAHGGRIWAESRVGEGSTFSFTLPFEQSGENSIE